MTPAASSSTAVSGAAIFIWRLPSAPCTAVAVQRGNKDGAYLIPVPHDTRKRGANGPIFSNHLSILFYRIEPKFAGRIGDILGELSRQMTDQIRDRFPESCMAALDMFKPLPLGYYVHHLGKPTRGKIRHVQFFGFRRNLRRHDGTVGRQNPGGHASGAGVAAAGTDDRVSCDLATGFPR